MHLKQAISPAVALHPILLLAISTHYSGHLEYLKQSIKNKIKGSVKEATGTIKEKAGRVTRNKETESRGTADKAGGLNSEKRRRRRKSFRAVSSFFVEQS